MEPDHIALVFFLFRSNPEMVPNTSIVLRCDLRESVLFVMMVVSPANCEIIASLLFGKRVPLQFGLWLIFNASNSTVRIKRERLGGHKWKMATTLHFQIKK